MNKHTKIIIDRTLAAENDEKFPNRPDRITREHPRSDFRTLRLHMFRLATMKGKWDAEVLKNEMKKYKKSFRWIFRESPSPQLAKVNWDEIYEFIKAHPDFPKWEKILNETGELHSYLDE